jgi:nitrous oxidase accessory protein NosD
MIFLRSPVKATGFGSSCAREIVNRRVEGCKVRESCDERADLDGGLVLEREAQRLRHRHLRPSHASACCTYRIIHTLLSRGSRTR